MSRFGDLALATVSTIQPRLCPKRLILKFNADKPLISFHFHQNKDRNQLFRQGFSAQF